MRGDAWMVIRRRVLAEEPNCYICGGAGRSDDVIDHVVGLAEHGTDDRSNLHRCCRQCSVKKTSRESGRGRR
ncbi:MAG: HNH endonuclease [Xanthomonadales bacterium]|nr:HNH endonuclease [Xanthomonadales bacterium]